MSSSRRMSDLARELVAGVLVIVLLALQQRLLNLQGKRMSKAIDDLRAAITKETTVTQSAIVLIQALKAFVDAAIDSGDLTALADLSAQLDASANQLAAAVSANTPVDVGHVNTTGGATSSAVGPSNRAPPEHSPEFINRPVASDANAPPAADEAPPDPNAPQG